jgi:hypothetical protein
LTNGGKFVHVFAAHFYVDAAESISHLNISTNSKQYAKIVWCSETTLTEESRFHISIPLGIELGSHKTGSKRVDHWTSGTVYKIAGSPQGFPPAADYVGCEARRRTCSERETGTKKLC